VAAFAALVAGPAHATLGAELIRNAPERYGRFEARLRFAAGDGVVSSMFLWKDGSEREGTYWNEIDIEKVGADCRGYSSNVIYGSPKRENVVRVSSSTDLCGGYHTHAFEWTPERLVWTLDGAEVRRLSGDELAAFEQNALPGMQLRFNLWVGDARFGGNFQPDILPVQQFIEWVAYARYTPGAAGGEFTPAWREEFAAPLGAGWAFGTWASPFGHSTHSPANVTLASGVGVLSLTEDSATGFSGAVPAEHAGGGAPGSAGTSGVGAGAPGAEADTGRPRASGCAASCGAGRASGSARLGLIGLGLISVRLARRRLSGT
jgi:hypothetical protein